MPSVSPYNSSNTGAISAMIRRLISARRVEPAEARSRSEVKSVLGRLGWLSTARYWGGTMKAWLIRSRSTNWRKVPGSNFVMITNGARTHQRGEKHQPGAVAVEWGGDQSNRLGREPKFECDPQRKLGSIVLSVDDALGRPGGARAVDDHALVGVIEPDGRSGRRLPVPPGLVTPPPRGLEADAEGPLGQPRERLQPGADDALEAGTDE